MSTTNLPHLMPLKEVIQTPGYSTRVMNLIDRIHRAPDVPGVLEMLRSSAETMGAEASIYATAIPEDDRSQSVIVLLACDPAWGYAQQRACPINEHPWFVYAREHYSPIVGRHLAPETARQHEAIMIAQQHGFSSALIVPTPAGGGLGRFGILCLGSSQQGEFEGEDTHVFRVFARTLAMELHEWFANETRAWLLRTTRLRPRDLQLLAMERRGLCTKEIVHVTGLSTDSVDSRFQRINTRLACPNRKCAALRAAEYGLI